LRPKQLPVGQGSAQRRRLRNRSEIMLFMHFFLLPDFIDRLTPSEKIRRCFFIKTRITNEAPEANIRLFSQV
uniref:hypothetical protein n=1 Tax=Candidatus Fimivicinus sp. TaxID=3056640 RepID=UPI003FEDBF81